MMVCDAASPHLYGAEGFCVEFHHFLNFGLGLGLGRRSVFPDRTTFKSLDNLVSSEHYHRGTQAYTRSNEELRAG
jgi:hypothetical protein